MLVDIIQGYLIIALSGGIFSYFKHFRRIQAMLEENEYFDHPLLANKVVGGLTWTLSAALFAPILLRPLLMDTHSERFITHTYEATIAD